MLVKLICGDGNLSRNYSSHDAGHSMKPKVLEKRIPSIVDVAQNIEKKTSRCS